MTAELVNRQRNYGQRGDAIKKKLDRYRRLRAEARGEPPPGTVPGIEAPSPDFVLAPYFAVAGENDPWWEVTRSVWAASEQLGNDISGVAAVTSPTYLATALAEMPTTLAETGFFWVTGLDERRATVDVLQAVASAVAQNSSRNWVNLYGGFFSICLSFFGLWGFNNGLGYSESRNWPELATTGAAPPRYYVPKLHCFMSPAAAQLVVDTDTFFACPCAVCTQADSRILHLTYRGFREHFAQARAWELKSVSEGTPHAIASELRETLTRFREIVAPQLPQTLVPDLRHLANWPAVLASIGPS